MHSGEQKLNTSASAARLAHTAGPHQAAIINSVTRRKKKKKACIEQKKKTEPVSLDLIEREKKSPRRGERTKAEKTEEETA